MQSDRSGIKDNTGKQNKYTSPAGAIITGVSDLFKKHEKAGEIRDEDRLDGKKVLITGSSSGLGFATAIRLAAKGAEVIMAVRSGIPEKGEKVKKLSGSNKVSMLHVDFSDISSIRQLVKELKSRHGKIDMLVCNAAMVGRKSRKTTEGLDEMFMVNYLSKYILVNRLLMDDCFHHRNGSVPRIIIVSSESHRNPKEFDWDNFGKYIEWGTGKSVSYYGYYKLLLVTFVNELSRRLNTEGNTGYSVFSLCPGPVNSNIAREAPAIFKPLLRLIFSIFFRSPQKASDPSVYLATSPDVEGKPLDYLFLMSRKDMDEKATDPENGKKLWELSENLCQQLGIELQDCLTV